MGFVLRVACIVIGHTYRVPAIGDHFHFGFEMGRIARSLAAGRGYANPFNGVSGPTAWVPPLYPLLMALAFKLFGVYTAGAAFFLLVVNSLFSAAIAPAVYEIGARCFDARGVARRGAKHAAPVALWSAWIWAVYPAAMQYAIHWLWEMSVSTCLFTWALVFALRLRRVGEPAGGRVSKSAEWLRWIWFGLLWGFIALSNASLLLCLPVMLVWIVWPSMHGRVGGRVYARIPQERGMIGAPTLMQQLSGVLLSCLVLLCVMLPWIVRNERALHAFVPTRSNMGVELDESLKPEHDAFPYGTALPLWPGDPEFKRYVAMGEIRYAHARGEEGKARLRANPRAFVHHTVDRVAFFWDGTPHGDDKRVQEFFRQLSYSFISVCGLLGVVLAVRRRVPAAWLFAGLFVALPLPYYAITVQPRFRHPLEPLIAVLAVYLFRSARSRGAAYFGAAEA